MERKFLLTRKHFYLGALLVEAYAEACQPLPGWRDTVNGPFSNTVATGGVAVTAGSSDQALPSLGLVDAVSGLRIGRSPGRVYSLFKAKAKECYHLREGTWIHQAPIPLASQSLFVPLLTQHLWESLCFHLCFPQRRVSQE